MTLRVSPGVYTQETDQSFIVPASASAVGGIVVTADKGPVNDVTLVTSPQQLIDLFGTPSEKHPSLFAALTYLRASNRLYVARAVGDATAASLNITDGDTPVFALQAKNPGLWGNSIVVSVTAADTTTKLFKITASAGNITETFVVSRVAGAKDGYGKSAYIEEVINNKSVLLNVVDTVSVDAHVAVTNINLSGGQNDTVPVTDGEINTEWDRFASKEAVPVGLLIEGGHGSTVVQTKMLEVAEFRKDCLALLDVPSDLLVTTDIVEYSTETLPANSSYGALYAGWLKVYDQFSDKTVLVAPSAFAAAAIARTASNAEVWYAPAGPINGRVIGAVGVHLVFSEGDRDALYEANVNPVQSFVGEGIQIYGQKTLQRLPSALDRVNVRLLMNQIEKDLAKGMRAFVFQFNDAFTRANIAAIAKAYLSDVKVRRGVYDFAVVVDETNNTPQVIDGNELRADIYVKPTRAAEFIRLNAIITATGATLSQA